MLLLNMAADSIRISSSTSLKVDPLLSQRGSTCRSYSDSSDEIISICACLHKAVGQVCSVFNPLCDKLREKKSC